MAYTQNESKGGLIGALVVFIVLFFVSTIVAIVQYVDKAKPVKELASVKTTQKLWFDAGDEGGVQPILAEQKTKYGGRTVVGVLNDQRWAVARKLMPTPADIDTTTKNFDAALADSRDRLKKVGVTLSSDTAVEAIAALTSVIESQKARLDGTDQQIATAGDAAKTEAAKITEIKAEWDRQLAAAKASYARETEAVKAEAKGKQARIDEIERDLAAAKTSVTTLTEEKGKQIAALEASLAGTRKEMANLQKALSARRFDPAEPMIRHIDGKVVSVSSMGDRVAIDLGEGDGVIAGLTFSVYDSVAGVPRYSTTETHGDLVLPPGKAEIEVIRVDKDSSECRVLSRGATARLSPGDLIANLFFCRETKLKFCVFGTFDLNRDGVASSNETALVKSLISQWGGQVTDTVGADTDFMIMGQMPRIPDLTPEIEKDPQLKRDYDKEQARLKEYTEKITEAQKFSVPIVNQNRLLFMLGYFKASKK